MPKVVVTDAKGLVQESGSGLFVEGPEGSSAPAYIALKSANGTTWYLSVGDDGQALVLSSQAPSANESSGGDDFKVDLA